MNSAPSYLTHAEAAEILRTRPDAAIVCKSRDATGHWQVTHRCWIADGELRQSHPTDDRVGATVAAPLDGLYIEVPSEDAGHQIDPITDVHRQCDRDAMVLP